MNRQEKEALKQEKADQAMYTACTNIIKQRPRVNFLKGDELINLYNKYQKLINEGLKVLEEVLDKHYIFTSIAMKKSERAKISEEFFHLMYSLGYSNGSYKYVDTGDCREVFKNREFKITFSRHYNSFNKNSRVVTIESLLEDNTFLYLDFSIRNNIYISINTKGMENIVLEYDVFTKTLEDLGSVNRFNVLTNINKTLVNDIYIDMLVIVLASNV